MTPPLTTRSPYQFSTGTNGLLFDQLYHQVYSLRTLQFW